MSERRAGWSVYGAGSPDGEETANFFRNGPKAVANMWDLLHALYCTYQGRNLLTCAAVAHDFRRHCTFGTASRYLVSLEHDVDAMLQNIWPFGLAMFCGDISESTNCFLKHGHTWHSN